MVICLNAVSLAGSGSLPLLTALGPSVKCSLVFLFTFMRGILSSSLTQLSGIPSRILAPAEVHNPPSKSPKLSAKLWEQLPAQAGNQDSESALQYIPAWHPSSWRSQLPELPSWVIFLLRRKKWPISSSCIQDLDCGTHPFSPPGDSSTHLDQTGSKAVSLLLPLMWYLV